jgi:hypothetical protein
LRATSVADGRIARRGVARSVDVRHAVGALHAQSTYRFRLHPGERMELRQLQAQLVVA